MRSEVVLEELMSVIEEEFLNQTFVVDPLIILYWTGVLTVE